MLYIHTYIHVYIFCLLVHSVPYNLHAFRNQFIYSYVDLQGSQVPRNGGHRDELLPLEPLVL